MITTHAVPPLSKSPMLNSEFSKTNVLEKGKVQPSLTSSGYFFSTNSHFSKNFKPLQSEQIYRQTNPRFLGKHSIFKPKGQ